MAVQPNITITKLSWISANISHSGLEVDWDFFATNHAKLAADGIGEAVKKLTASAGLQRPYNNQTLSEETIYQFCSKTIENILFNLIERDTLNLLWDKLACQYEHE